MQKSIKYLPLLILTFFSAVQLSAQDKRLIAEARLINKQKEIIDSAFVGAKGSSTMMMFDEDEYPAFESYSDEWSSSVVDPYNIKISQLPDSFTIDCSDYYPPIESKVNSCYGPRWGRFHSGIDLDLNIGDKVHAAFDGKVRIAKVGQGYGYYVILRHQNGLETLYGHLSKILVDVGQEVKAGDVIALGGNTGRSTGPHLHFETRFLGKAIDPAKLFDFRNHVPYEDNFMVYKNKTFKEKENFIRYGSSTQSKSVVSSSKASYYTVKNGDTLSKISKKYGVSVSNLCKLNKLKSSSKLKPGQKLRYS